MNNRPIASAAVVLGILTMIATVLGCAGGPAANDFAGPVGKGEEFLADSIEMTAPQEWKEAPPYPTLAEFQPGIQEDGVTAVEFQLGYGETSVVWNLSGFEPNQPVTISSDVNVDFFGTETYLSISYLSGLVDAEDAIDPREEINAAIVYKWADADPGDPDTTNGWQTVLHTVDADDKGTVSMIMIMGRAADDPPVVFGYLTNPVTETP